MNETRPGGPTVAADPTADPVTGTLTRAMLDRRLPELVTAAADGQDRFAIVLFDVDYFKSVNDAYGHARGDKVLRQVAERVAACIQAGDELYRQGGDEFALLLPRLDREQALGVAVRIADTMTSAPLPGDIALSVSVSLGVAAYPEDGQTAKELVETADRRNYLAKRRGRGCAVADDVDTGASVVTGRLLQRDNALTAAARFCDHLLDVGAGVLAVHGPQGVGHTRFLEEVSRIARLRGFEVLDPTRVAADARRRGRHPTGPPARLLVIDDHGSAADLRRLVGVLRAEAPEVLGVVRAATEGDVGSVDVGLPELDTVELQPWNPGTVRIWIRTVLQSEPSDRLVKFIHRASRGLPAKARRELDRIGDEGILRRGDDGRWDVVVMASAPASAYRVPTPLTPLIGREEETAEVADLIAQHRLVTMTGPGGVGKTRLSLAAAAAVADYFPQGVAFIPLEDATDEVGVLSALGLALRVSESARPLFDVIVEFLEDRCLLLVLDNFEQALGAAPAIGRLLAFAPAVKALVTSREQLRLYGERVFPVRPLPLPDLLRLPGRADDIPDLVAASPALALFEARAGAAVHRFALTPQTLPVVARLCHRLDGLPLAIELAAARSDALTPEDILAGIVDRMDLLSDGPQDLPGRQRSLRAAIDWSVDLLDAVDQMLFDQLAVFTDGWTEEAATAVCRLAADATSADLGRRLTTLADKNLLTEARQADGTARYSMLETIRQHAADRLAVRPDADDVRLRHATFHATFAEKSSHELTGPDQAEWIGLIRRDYPNLRMAFSFAVAAGHHILAGRIAVGLWRYWRNGEYIHEGRSWLAGVLTADVSLPPALRTHALHAAGLLAATQDDYQTATRLGEESLRMARKIDDAVACAQAVNLLGFAAMGTGDYDTADACFTDSLDRWAAQDNPLGMATAYGNLTKVALRRGDTQTASEWAAAAVALDRRVGNTRGIALGLECLGQLRLLQGDAAGARELLGESLALSRSLGDVFGESVALHHLGLVAEHEGDRRAAIGRITLALALRYEVGDQEGVAASLERLADLVVDDPALAANLLDATTRIRERYGLPEPIESMELLAQVRKRVEDQFEAGSAAHTHRPDADLPIGHLVEHLIMIAPDARL